MKASKRTLFDCVSFPAQTKLISTLHVGHVSIYTSHAAKLSYPYIIRYLSGDQNSTIKESSWTALIWLRNLPFSQIPSCPRSLSAKLSNHFFKATNFILDHLALPLFSRAREQGGAARGNTTRRGCPHAAWMMGWGLALHWGTSLRKQWGVCIPR